MTELLEYNAIQEARAAEDRGEGYNPFDTANWAWGVLTTFQVSFTPDTDDRVAAIKQMLINGVWGAEAYRRAIQDQKPEGDWGWQGFQTIIYGPLPEWVGDDDGFSNEEQEEVFNAFERHACALAQHELDRRWGQRSKGRLTAEYVDEARWYYS